MHSTPKKSYSFGCSRRCLFPADVDDIFPVFSPPANGYATFLSSTPTNVLDDICSLQENYLPFTPMSPPLQSADAIVNYLNSPVKQIPLHPMYGEVLSQSDLLLSPEPKRQKLDDLNSAESLEIDLVTRSSSTQFNDGCLSTQISEINDLESQPTHTQALFNYPADFEVDLDKTSDNPAREVRQSKLPMQPVCSPPSPMYIDLTDDEPATAPCFHYSDVSEPEDDELSTCAIKGMSSTEQLLSEDDEECAQALNKVPFSLLQNQESAAQLGFIDWLPVYKAWRPIDEDHVDFSK